MGALSGSEHVVRSPMIIRGSVAAAAASSSTASPPSTEPPADEIRLNVATSGVGSPEHRSKKTATTPSTSNGSEEKKTKRKQRIHTPGGGSGTPSQKAPTPSNNQLTAATVATPSAASVAGSTFVLHTELNPSPTARRVSLPPLANDVAAGGTPLTLQGSRLAGPSSSITTPKRRTSSSASPKRSSKGKSPKVKKRDSTGGSPVSTVGGGTTSTPLSGGRRPSLTMGRLPGAPTIRVAPTGSRGSGSTPTTDPSTNDLGDNFALNFNP
jgi:hypothetical protein